MKKILFLYGPLGAGGAERVLLDLLNNLDYTKYEVDLCLIINQGVLLPEVPKEIKLITLWESYSFYYKVAYRLSIWFCNNYMLKRILKQKITKDYDVEISFLEGMPVKLHALMNNSGKKITWVHCDLFNFHYTKNSFAAKEELSAYNKMNKIVAVSNDAEKAFEKRFPNCKTEKIVIYNPIDIQKITQLASDFAIAKNERFTIVAIGRLTMPKRIDRVIRLAARLKNENIDVDFLIIGDGELKEELVELTFELKVDDRVEFLGFMKNPFPYIKNADMMLLSSAYEGFGLVICEAMLLGVPVVSTKTAGPTEIIDEDKYGLLCEHDDEAIYRAVKKMIDDEALRQHYAKTGLKRAKDFDVKKMIKEFDDLIGQA